ALFGAVPPLGATLKALPRLLLRGAVPALTVWRLSPTRSLTLPVQELEGLFGARAAARRAVLLDGAGGAAAGLLLAGQGLGHWLPVALLALPFWYGQDELGERLGALLADPNAIASDRALAWWIAGAYLVAVSVVEPIYVVAGFALYLNRRTLLEGW